MNLTHTEWTSTKRGLSVTGENLIVAYLDSSGWLLSKSLRLGLSELKNIHEGDGKLLETVKIGIQQLCSDIISAKI